MTHDYAIVGMGVGGLTLGALLAAAGRKVAIFEQHYVPGGYGHTFIEGRYAFCAELHYVWDCGPGERVTRMLEKVGLADEVTFRRLDPNGFDRVIGPDVDFTIGSGFDRELDRLASRFPAHERGLERYYGIVQAIHRQLYDLPIGFSWLTILSAPHRYPHLIRYAFWTLEQLFDRLKFPRALRLILAGQSAIFFSPPRELSLIAHAGGVASYDQGAYHPAQSYRHVMRSLLGVIKERPGCVTKLSTEVTTINIDGGRAQSVVTADGQEFPADAVIVNADVQASIDLIGRNYFSRSQLRRFSYDYGPSVLSVYLGLDGIDLREHGLGEENIFWHPKVDLNRVYADQLDGGIPERPYFFCNSPTLRHHEKPIAPAGGSQLVIVAPTSYEYFSRIRRRSEDEYQMTKQLFADRLIGVVEDELVPGISNHIAVKAVGSPLTNEFYVKAPYGNCYGSPLDPAHVRQRTLNYRSPVENVFYVGSSAGMPGFASVIHFACLLYERLTGDPVY